MLKDLLTLLYLFIRIQLRASSLFWLQVRIAQETEVLRIIEELRRRNQS